MSLSREELHQFAEAAKERQEKHRLDGLKTPVEIKCVVCDCAITTECGCDAKDEKLASRYANHSSFDNGAVGTIAFGYGCQHDGDVLIIAICKDCYVKKLETQSVLFTHSYIP